MNLLRISAFSDIILGYNFRSAIEEDENGNAYIIQAKNIIQGENIHNREWLTRISFPWARTGAFLERHDILIVSRGTGVGSFRATIFDMDDSNVIASGSLIIIRVKSPAIIPEYVCLYLNSDEGRKKIIETLSWWTIHTISPGKFREIGIPIIPAEKQHILSNLHQNLLTQKKIQTKKNNLYNQILSSTLKQLTLS